MVRVSGVPNDGVILAVDTALGSTFVDGIGTISLNVGSPTMLILLDGSVPVPGSGNLDLVFTVPGLSGLTAYFEGVIIPAGVNPPLLITNVLAYTIL